MTERLEQSPRSVPARSARGDAYFFLGQFDKAVADYAAMVEIDPKLNASHWRLGIAYYFANDFAAAAKQFEAYHTHDDVDRENGIWRYLSQYRARGSKFARQELLKYRHDDRPPFETVYQMFSGESTPQEVVEIVSRAAAASPETRDQQLFYMHLYVGLYLQILGEQEPAQKHLQRAAESEWPPQAGYGPEYMRQVARLALEHPPKDER